MPPNRDVVAVSLDQESDYSTSIATKPPAVPMNSAASSVQRLVVMVPTLWSRLRWRRFDIEAWLDSRVEADA